MGRNLEAVRARRPVARAATESWSRHLVGDHRPWWRGRRGRLRPEERNPLSAKDSPADWRNWDEPASFLQRNGDEEGTRPLTLRITPAPSDDPGILRLEGRLRAEEVPELEKSAEAGVRALDLQDLVSADEEGLAALRRLRDRGVEIRNSSHYLAMRLA